MGYEKEKSLLINAWYNFQPHPWIIKKFNYSVKLSGLTTVAARRVNKKRKEGGESGAGAGGEEQTALMKNDPQY